MLSVSRRTRALAAAGVLAASLALSASPALAVTPDPFCPTAFTAGTDEALADLLAGFATLTDVQSLDRNGNDQICWLHIPGVGYNILDDGTPR
jgi:hypothetical protein